MTNPSIKYLRSDAPIPIYFKPPISPTDTVHPQFFYHCNPLIKFPYHLKIVFIITIENNEDKPVLKSQIISNFVLYKMIEIKDLHEANLRVIEVLQKTFQEKTENEFLKTYEIPVPSIIETQKDVTLNYDLLCGLIIDIHMN